MNSIAKKYVQSNNTPVYQHYVNWVGLLEDTHHIALDHHILDFWGLGERFGIVPISHRRAYWAGCKALLLDHRETNSKEYLRLTFKDWPSLIPEVIAQTSEQHIRRIAVFDHDPHRQWFKNNVCLLEDTAHASLPTSGQGACQALEDAWHLAKLLDQSSHMAEAFEAYTHIRFKKTTSITLAARALSASLFNTDKEYCLERNKQAKVADYDQMAKSMSALWSEGLPMILS